MNDRNYRDSAAALSRAETPGSLSAAELRRKYDEISGRYDRLVAFPERLVFSRLRRRLLAEVRGRVLEIGFGTGRNADYYPSGCEVTGMDLSRGMLGQARNRLATRRRPVELAVMDAQRLGFPDGAFNTVVDTLSLCTIPDPVRALSEMARVTRPGGSILLLEHGRSRIGWMAWLQDRGAARHYRDLGCRWNLEPMDYVTASGIRIEHVERRAWGVFSLIVAHPA